MASEYLSSNAFSVEQDGLCLANVSHQTLQSGLHLGTDHPIKNHPRPQLLLTKHGLTCQHAPPVPVPSQPSPLPSSLPAWPSRHRLSGQRLGHTGQSHPLLFLVWHDDVIFWSNRKACGAPMASEGCNLQFFLLLWAHVPVVICSVGITELTQIVGSLVVS